MKTSEIEQLAHRVLYAKAILQNKSCFVISEEGRQLTRCTADALPIIEDIICGIIEPAILQKGEVSGFPGIDYLLGAYLVIGARERNPRVAQFLQKRHPRLIAEAIGYIPVFFRKTENGYSFGVAPSQDIVELVRQNVLSHYPYLMNISNWVMRNALNT